MNFVHFLITLTNSKHLIFKYPIEISIKKSLYLFETQSNPNPNLNEFPKYKAEAD